MWRRRAESTFLFPTYLGRSKETLLAGYKTVKYIYVIKVVSAPKKSILKIKSLSNIHVFKFAFGSIERKTVCICLACVAGVLGVTIL